MFIDLGDNHALEFSPYKGDIYASAHVDHLTPEGMPCEHFIAITGHAWADEFKQGFTIQSWELLSINPLTLFPSLLCRACGDHGSITNGKWIRA
jgi:hypothetical protein